MFSAVTRLEENVTCKITWNDRNNKKSNDCHYMHNTVQNEALCGFHRRVLNPPSDAQNINFVKCYIHVTILRSKTPRRKNTSNFPKVSFRHWLVIARIKDYKIVQRVQQVRSKLKPISLQTLCWIHKTHKIIALTLHYIPNSTFIQNHIWYRSVGFVYLFF